MSRVISSPKETLRQQLNRRLDEDFPFYAKYNLKIRTKAGGIEPFILNDAQRRLNEFAEKQKSETGRIRILIPKARQEGCSTYIAGRFYRNTTRNKGKSTFILSHLSDTTEKLFQMIERFQKYCPDPVRVTPDIANRRRMKFGSLESEYFVGTAGTDSVGRGGTVQYLHASEAAYYPENSDFSKGILQSVPDLPGTEVFIESTANGMDALFYVMCMDALQGKSEFRVFFIPWFWERAYRRALPEGFICTEEEVRLKQVFSLDDEQIYWRRTKISSDFKGNIKDFMQEYPATVDEAFISSGDNLISSFKVMEARKSLIEDPHAPLVIAADANEAQGRSGFTFRRGRVVEKVFAVEGRKPMELVGIIADQIDTCNPVKYFIDTGNGYGIIDRLIELGYGDIVVGVSFNEGALEDTVYLNKRCEMYFDFKKWIEDGGVRIPDNDRYHKEIVATPDATKTSSGLKKLMPKEEIQKNTKMKLDLVDSTVLTFAYPIRVESWHHRVKAKQQVVSKVGSIRRRKDMGQRQGNSASATLRFP